jgi:glucosyl-dolichyl phosphate glucuronosyltransferase
MSAKKITVIICTYNRSKLLNNALLNLGKQTLDKDFFNILVVDNNSSDNTEDVVKYHSNVLDIEYIKEERQGLSFARNRGILESDTEYIAYMDDDCEASSRWLAEIINTFEGVNPKPVAVGGKTIVKFDNPKPSWINKNLEMFLGFFWLMPDVKRYLGEGEYLVGNNMAFSRKELMELRGFNENLGRNSKSLLSNEEVELFKRFEDNNFPIYYDPDILVWHYAHPDRLKKRWFYKRYFWQGISDCILDEKKRNKSKNFLFYKLVKLIVKLFITFDMEKRCMIFWEWGRIFYEFGFYQIKKDGK